MSNVLNIVGARRSARRRVGAAVGDTRGTGEFRQEYCSDGVWRVRGSCPVGGGGGIQIPPPETVNRPWIPTSIDLPPPPPPVHVYPPPNSTIPYNPPYLPPPVTYDPPPPPNSTIPSGGGGCAPPVNVCPENQKNYVMPFEPSSGYTATVAAAATTVWQGKPQKLFKPSRLMIASTIAPYFNITDFRIANIPQTLSAGAVAADIYSEVSTYGDMSFDQAYPGIDIILTAVNKSSVTQTFQAQLIGWLVG